MAFFAQQLLLRGLSESLSPLNWSEGRSFPMVPIWSPAEAVYRVTGAVYARSSRRPGGGEWWLVGEEAGGAAMGAGCLVPVTSRCQRACCFGGSSPTW